MPEPNPALWVGSNPHKWWVNITCPHCGHKESGAVGPGGSRGVASTCPKCGGGGLTMSVTGTPPDAVA